MRYLSLLLIVISTSLFGMHHEKLDVIVFAIDLEIIDGQKNKARNFVSRITDNVNKKEPQTLVYQYHFSKKEKKVFLLEIYPNNDAAQIHMDNFLGSKWETEFIKNFSISKKLQNRIKTLERIIPADPQLESLFDQLQLIRENERKTKLANKVIKENKVMKDLIIELLKENQKLKTENLLYTN